MDIYPFLRKLAEKRGIKIMEVDLPIYLNGVFANKGNIYAIFLNSKLPCSGLKSAALAHELAHYTLHRDCNFNCFADDYNQDLELVFEKEANCFTRRLISFIRSYYNG